MKINNKFYVILLRASLWASAVNKGLLNMKPLDESFAAAVWNDGPLASICNKIDNGLGAGGFEEQNAGFPFR